MIRIKVGSLPLILRQREETEALLSVHEVISTDIHVASAVQRVQETRRKASTNSIEEIWKAFEEQEATSSSSWTTDVTEIPLELVVIEKSQQPRRDTRGGDSVTLARGGRAPSRDRNSGKSRNSTPSRRKAERTVVDDRSSNSAQRPRKSSHKSNSTTTSSSKAPSTATTTTATCAMSNNNNKRPQTPSRPRSRTPSGRAQDNNTATTTTCSHIGLISPSKRDLPSERARLALHAKKELSLQANGVMTPSPRKTRGGSMLLRSSLGRLSSPRRRSQLVMDQSGNTKPRRTSSLAASECDSYHPLSDASSLDLTVSTASMSTVSSSEASKPPYSEFDPTETDFDESSCCFVLNPPRAIQSTNNEQQQQQQDSTIKAADEDNKDSWRDHHHPSNPFSAMDTEEEMQVDERSSSSSFGPLQKSSSFHKSKGPSSEGSDAGVRRLVPLRFHHQDQADEDTTRPDKTDFSPRRSVNRQVLPILGDHSSRGDASDRVPANERPANIATDEQQQQQSSIEPAAVSLLFTSRSYRVHRTDSDDGELWRLQSAANAYFHDYNKRPSPRRSTRSQFNAKRNETEFPQVLPLAKEEHILNPAAVCHKRVVTNKAPQEKRVSWKDLTIMEQGANNLCPVGGGGGTASYHEMRNARW